MVGDLPKNNQRSRGWLVKGVLRRGDILMIYGPSGVGLTDALGHDLPYSEYLREVLAKDAPFEGLYLHPDSNLLRKRAASQRKQLSEVRQEIINSARVILRLGRKPRKRTRVWFYRKPPLWRVCFRQEGVSSVVYVRHYNANLEDRDQREIGYFKGTNKAGNVVCLYLTNIKWGIEA